MSLIGNDDKTNFENASNIGSTRIKYPDMTNAPSVSSSTRTAVLVCSAAMISLAVAMGVGRFAFTPMFPLMVRDGLLNNENGTLLAAGNYLGYLLGAILAGRIKMKPSFLLVFGLLSTAALTGAVG